MTIENEVYGAEWEKCSRCGVKDRPDQLVAEAGGHRHIDAKVETCAAWLATLTRATPADIQTLRQAWAAGRSTSSSRAAELKAGNTALKTWAGRPWANPHGEHKAAK